MDIQELNFKVATSSALLDNLRTEIAKVIVGQDAIINRLLIGLLANGHIL